MPDVELGDLRLDTVPIACVNRAIRPPTSTRTPARSMPCTTWPAATRRELGDASWPPHFPKQKGEPERVQPSRDRDRPKKPKPKPKPSPGRIVGDPQPPGPRRQASPSPSAAAPAPSPEGAPHRRGPEELDS